MTRLLALAACFCFGVAGSALAQTAGSIQKLDNAWSQAFNRGDAAAIAAMYAPNADVLPPGHDMVKGRAAIEAFWKGATQQLGGASLARSWKVWLRKRFARLSKRAQQPQVSHLGRAECRSDAHSVPSCLPLDIWA